MKTRLILLSAAAIAAVSLNTNAQLLTPRAAGNQIKVAPAVRNGAGLVDLDRGLASSPRVAGNAIARTAGANNTVAAAAVCARNMSHAPRAVQACVESGTMAGCNAATVATLK